jgi:hypothetical protein
MQSLSMGLSAQWVLAGYLSGMNVEASGPDPVADFDGLMGWIDKSHPLDLVRTAAFKLMGELLSQAKR